MIKKIKSLEDNFSIFKAASIVGFLAFLSRLVGLFRNAIFAGHFGAGDTLDAYFAAFRIPDFIFNLLILGTLSVAFIPVFSEWLVNDKQRAYKIANTVLNFSAVLMFGVCLILLIFIKPLSRLLVPGFTETKFNDVVTLTRIFLLSPIIFTLSNIFGSVLQAQKKFLITSIAPILYNLGIIFGVLYLYPKFGIAGLGWGVILGALVHLLTQFFESFRYGFRWQPVLNFKDDAVIRISKLFVPRIIGLDISQINLIVASIVGSFLASGTITEFAFSNDFNALPVGIFAVALATVSFPVLCEEYAKKNERAYLATLSNMMIQILFFLIPFSILILTFRAHLVRLSLGYGKFDWNDTRQTFGALGIMAVSLFAQGLTPLFSRAFYARQNTIIPVIVNLFCVVLDAILAYTLGKRFGVSGIAAAFSIASIVNASALFWLLRNKLLKEVSYAKELFRISDLSLLTQVLKILFASLVMGLVGHYCLYFIEPWVDTHKVFGLLVQSGSSSLIAILSFIFIAKALKLAQIDTAIIFIKKTFKIAA